MPTHRVRKTTAENVTSPSYECEQRQDESTSLSSTTINDVNKREHDNGDGDLLCDTLLRHLNDVGSEVFRDAGEVVSVRPINDAKMQKSWDPVTNCFSKVKNPGTENICACSVCHETFSSFILLASHKHIHSGMKPDASDKSVKRTDVRPYVCCVCTKAFMKSSALTTHLQTHVGDNLHKCEVCHKQFTRRSSIKKHMLSHTGQRPHVCYLCHKQFILAGHLKAHMRTHTGEKPQKCEVCNKQFSQLGHLKTHMLRHTGERAHECVVCHRRFTRGGHLKRHMLIHSGEKPHKCHVCNQQFTRRDHLKAHLPIHTGEMMFTCSLCQRQFSQRSGFNKHMLIHSDEKRHKCDICAKAFRKSNDLTRHKNTHTRTRSKLYTCYICDEQFSACCKLKVHVLTHIGETSHSG